MAMAIGCPDAVAAPLGHERTLLEGCRQGDPQAFARLVSLHERLVYNLAARLLGDFEEARDVSQDVFLQVFRTLGRFQERSSLRTWIYRIVVNQCRNRQRWWRRRRKDRSVSIEELGAADQARLSAAGGLEDDVARAELARAVQRALQRLPFAHRTVLLLREVEGLTCEEAAETLSVPVGTVKSRLARAREALRLAVSEQSAPGGSR